MTYAMNELLSFSVNLLSAAQAWGGAATLLLFAFSFIAVHAVKLASKGYLLYKEEEKKKADEKTPVGKKSGENERESEREKPQDAQPAPAPVYYLVEKKRVRKKPPEYAEPRRVRFDDEGR